MVPAQHELEALGYRELQKLAKDLGIKANQNKAQLLEELASAREASSGPTVLNKTFDKEDSKAPAVATATPGKRSSAGATISRDSGRFVEFVAKPKTPPTSTAKKPHPAVQAVRRPQSPRKTNTPVTPKATDSKSSLLSATKRLAATPKEPREVLRARFAGTPSSVSKKQIVSSTAKKTVEVKPTVLAGTQIPRFVSKRAPNFAKMHAQEFDKMDSLDVYLSKKKERTQSMKKKFAQSKRIASDLEEAMTKVKKLSTHEKKSAAVRRSPRNLENPRPQQQVFVPSSLTVNEKLFQFGGPSSGKPFKFTASPRKSCVNTPKHAILANITNNTVGTPGSAAKKAAFNLKESLAKPLTYQPHKGKLVKWEEKKKQERQAMGMKNGGMAAAEKKKMAIKGVRLNKRAELLMQRRNNLS